MEIRDTKPKRKPTRIDELTKEQIRQAIIRKRECNAKAQQIVENLLEKDITESYFLKCLADINQSHLDDVIEERAIIHICGYPLCQNNISEKDIPKQKYRISVKTNKVYDITARKSFCSNTCYKSAIYIKKQLLTSPLWFREYEEIPKFHLLPLDTVGSLGQEVDVALVEKIKAVKPRFSSINDFATASFNEMTATQCDSTKDENQDYSDAHKITTKSNSTLGSSNEKSDEVDYINESLTNKKTCQKDQQDNKQVLETHNPNTMENSINQTVKKQASKQPNPFNIVGEIVEKPEKKIDPILTQVPTNNTDNAKPYTKHKNVKQKKQPVVTVLTIQVEKCLAEWFTLDTMLLLFGEDKVKEIVADKGKCIKEYLNNYSKSIAYNSNTYDQYQALCRKLNMLELEDRKFDAQTLQKETKPLPDYTSLQEESKKLQLKVKAFFAGEMEVPKITDTEITPLLVPIDDNEKLTQLPLVDKNAQNALRRRIVCEHMNKVLPDLLQSLGLLSLSINSDVRLLVNTFKLKANNIMFKPIQWTLIAIIVIKLLSLRDRRLSYLLEQPTAYQHLQLLLLSFKQDGGYLDRLISWLTDIDRLLDTNDMQLTVE
ncbi:putative RNA polymerase II subunit B1 CTD phosphatase RPAP2 [Aphomia sociella]